MVNTAFIMVPEAGHQFASYGLASRLQARGHAIRFLGVARFEAAARERGFAYRTAMDDFYTSPWTRPS